MDAEERDVQEKKELLDGLRRLARQRVVLPRAGDAPAARTAVIGDKRTRVEEVRCPSCGAPLEQADVTDDGICTCDYCGTLVRVGVGRAADG